MKKLLLLLLMSFMFLRAETKAHEIKRVQGYVNKYQHELNLDLYTFYLSIQSEDFLTKAYCQNNKICLSAGDTYFGLSMPLMNDVPIFILRKEDYTKKVLKNSKIKNYKVDQENSVYHELLHVMVNSTASEEGLVTVLADSKIKNHKEK